MSAWGTTLIESLAADFTSLKATWAWVYLTLYAALAIYGAVKVPSAMAPIIETTGAVVSVIFTGYVFASTKAKAKVKS